VFVFRVSRSTGRFIDDPANIPPKKRKKLPPADRLQEGPAPWRLLQVDEEAGEINQITVEICGDTESLIVVTMRAQVRIYPLQFIRENRDPIIFDNVYTNEDDSTWSISAAARPRPSQGPILAVGSNAHVVTEWNLSGSEDQTPHRLVGHGHNIPSIAYCPGYPESCDYLASASIDGTFRLWHAARGECLGIYRIAEWGWGIRWVHKDDIPEVDLSRSLRLPPRMRLAWSSLTRTGPLADLAGHPHPHPPLRAPFMRTSRWRRRPPIAPLPPPAAPAAAAAPSADGESQRQSSSAIARSFSELSRDGGGGGAGGGGGPILMSSAACGAAAASE